MLDEERLDRLAAKGDRAAFEELYWRTAPWTAVRLSRRCADEQIVAEVMQETYLAVWRAASAFVGSAVGGTAWLLFSCIAPPPTGVPTQAAAWKLLPPGTTAGTWTALVLAVAGIAIYAFAGPGR